MKICPKCGEEQDDTRTTCIDCGKMLGKPLSNEQTEQREREISDRIDNFANRTDYFRLNNFRITLIAVNAAIAIISIVLMIIDADYYLPVLFYSVIISAYLIIENLFPRFFWNMVMLRYRLYTDDTPTAPSQLYEVEEKVGNVILTVLNSIILLSVII